jgi:hypothetical protein
MGERRLFEEISKDVKQDPIGLEEFMAIVRAMEGIKLPRGVAVGVTGIVGDHKPGEPLLYHGVQYSFAGRGRLSGRMIVLDVAVHAAPDEESMERLNRCVDIAYLV